MSYLPSFSFDSEACPSSVVLLYHTSPFLKELGEKIVPRPVLLWKSGFTGNIVI